MYEYYVKEQNLEEKVRKKPYLPYLIEKLLSSRLSVSVQKVLSEDCRVIGIIKERNAQWNRDT